MQIADQFELSHSTCPFSALRMHMELLRRATEEKIRHAKQGKKAISTRWRSSALHRASRIPLLLYPAYILNPSMIFCLRSASGEGVGAGRALLLLLAVALDAMAAGVWQGEEERPLVQ
jgi:hypothetical protein